MLKNYLKIAFRSILKQKGFSAINIFGLAIGLACSLLIFLYVQDETSYDQFHADAGNIHRIVKDFLNDDGSSIPDATTPAALAPAVQKEIPEIAKITRVFPNWGGSWLVKYGDKKITEEKLYRVDSSFFEVFTFPFVKGNPKTALQEVKSITISESAAKRYFGIEDPMGKILTLDPLGDMMITGVFKDVPANAHFHFDFLVSFRQLPGNLDANWGGYNYYTYMKVKPGTDMAGLTKKIQGVYEKSQEERYSVFYTQPLTDIHLTSHLKWELEPNGDKLYVYVFTIIALFILLIAAINYINLSTAKSSVRAKEIGIRKVSGAIRSMLVRQFLIESVIIALLACFTAILLSQLLISAVNTITHKQLAVIGNPLSLLYMLIAAILVGLFAGIFPALYLSSFKPIAVLKGLKVGGKGALTLRKSLVVVQFTISIVLIFGALIIAQQIKYIQSAKLGFDKEQVMIIKNAGFLTRSDRAAFLNKLKELPGAKKAAGSNMSMGGGFNTTRISTRGSDKEQQLNFSSVGYEYFDVMGMEMKEGRGFSVTHPGDTISNGIPGGPMEQVIGGIVINETAVKDFGLTEPVTGKQFLWDRDGDTSYYVNIVGVANDFHFTSLRNEIKPFGFLLSPNSISNYTIKLSTGNIQETISQLEKSWNGFVSGRPFEYTFLDETFTNLYASEARFQKVFISLVILGILIACLGLLGLATYAAQQRIKEIGIRKTLGASVTDVVALLSKDFLLLVIIALVIAIPIGGFMMNQWLQDFAYRINIAWWNYLVAGIIALIIAFATISMQTIKAAMANPVKNLRTE